VQKGRILFCRARPTGASGLWQGSRGRPVLPLRALPKAADLAPDEPATVDPATGRGYNRAMYEIRKIPVTDAPTETLLGAVRGVMQPEMIPLAREMRGLIPVDGDDWVKLITVAIEPGQTNHQGQNPHSHEEWTAVYYHDLGDPAVPIYVEAERSVDEIVPAPGDVIVIPPGVRHWVAPSRSARRRVSVAMLVEAPGTRSKFR